MAKSKIIKELANGAISLEVAINRLLIIASDIENLELSQWAEKELQGYSAEDEIPYYRIVKNTRIKYSGINGSFQVTNADFPFSIEDLFPEEYKWKARRMLLFEGVRLLEDLASGNGEKEYGQDLLWLAGLINDKYGIQCYSITQLVPQNAFINAVNGIKLATTKILLALDKAYGSLDELDIDASGINSDLVQKTNTIINQYILYDHSVKIGDKNKIEESTISIS